MTPSRTRRTSVSLTVAALLASQCFASAYVRHRPTTGKGQFREGLETVLSRALKKDEDETLAPTAAPTEKKSMNNKNKYDNVVPAQSPGDRYEEGDPSLQNDDWIDYEPPVNTDEPTEEPTAEPTEEPTEEPTAEPTLQPTPGPTAEPTLYPTASPTSRPTSSPTGKLQISGSSYFSTFVSLKPRQPAFLLFLHHRLPRLRLH